MEEDIRWINLGFVNAYLLKANDGYILIDTGIAQSWSRLKNELRRAGALPDRLKLVVLTHGDFDHSGNCAGLQSQYHAQVAIHPGDAEIVKTGLALKRTARSLPGKLFVRLTGLMRGSFHTFQPDVLLEDGQDFSQYGLAARVIYTPGHTRGSIAVLTDSGHLFIGDTFGNNRKLSRADYVQNEQELQKSIQRLQGLQASMVYPGHGEPFAFEKLSRIES